MFLQIVSKGNKVLAPKDRYTFLRGKKIRGNKYNLLFLQKLKGKGGQYSFSFKKARGNEYCPSFLQKLKGKEGQHAMEYMILLTLVMAGIIIAGPYVVRSWNANLKGWEDSALDSLQDPFLLGDPDPTLIGGCKLVSVDWSEVACNIGIYDPCEGGTFTCGVKKMLEERTFDPPGCQCAQPPSVRPKYLRCTLHDCCCTAPVPTGKCGINATGTGDILGCAVFPPPAVTPTQKNPDGTCPDGMMEVYVTCGSDPSPRYGCIPHADCNFSCEEPATIGTGPAYGGLCLDDDIGLGSTTNYSYVAYDECTDPVKCERECAEDAFVFGTGASSSCGPCLEEDIGIDTGVCPEGQYDPLGCPAGEYKSCCMDVPPPPAVTCAEHYDMNSCCLDPNCWVEIEDFECDPYDSTCNCSYYSM